MYKLILINSIKECIQRQFLKGYRLLIAKCQWSSAKTCLSFISQSITMMISN